VTTVENVVSDTQCCSAEGTEGQDSDVRPWVTWVSFLARLVLAGIWIVSGVLKASNMMETRVAVRGSSRQCRIHASGIRDTARCAPSPRH